MAEEIKSPPPKRQKDLFLGCFGCGSRTTFKSIANAEVKKKVVRGRGPRLYWSISKSTASTVPVEAAAAAIVATVKTAVESDKSGIIRRYSQQRLERAISAAAADGSPPGATQEKSRDERKPRRTESVWKKRSAAPHPQRELPRPPPIGFTASADVIRPKPGSDNRVDPMVGMWIVMVTLMLMVMVSWGKVSAILWTAAWFYVLPWLRRRSNREIMNKAVVDGREDDYLSSEEYKKKVVLDGLLHRNHHRT